MSWHAQIMRQEPVKLAPKDKVLEWSRPISLNVDATEPKSSDTGDNAEKILPDFWLIPT